MHGYLDCSSGVSGDKLLGALIDAGFDPLLLRTALDAIGLTAVVVQTDRRTSRGVSAVGVEVTEPGAPRRHWRDLAGLLAGAPLPAPVLAHAHATLEALAGAEARVHGVDVGDVHFHEIGAADTIVDVLGVALGLHALGIERLIASPVAIGSGTVETEHGTLGVPAPATALLLQGVPVVAGPATGELTTPTGAALLRTCVDGFGVPEPMMLRRVGFGRGTRDIGVPNVCRLLLGEPLTHEADREDVVVLESNIDHLTPEELATAAGRLRDAGALDVWQTPIVMKKGRAAVLLSVLAAAADAAALSDALIAETGTLGVRVLPAWRRVAGRDVAEVETSLGRARFKIARLPDGSRSLRVEADDAARIASEHGLATDAAARVLEADAARATGVQPMRQTPSSEVTNPSA